MYVQAHLFARQSLHQAWILDGAYAVLDALRTERVQGSAHAVWSPRTPPCWTACRPRWDSHVPAQRTLDQSAAERRCRHAKRHCPLQGSGSHVGLDHGRPTDGHRVNGVVRGFLDDAADLHGLSRRAMKHQHAVVGESCLPGPRE